MQSRRALAIALALAATVGFGAAEAATTIVNLDATKGTGPWASETYAGFQTISLGAGTYHLSVIDNTANGGYNGYNYNTNTGIYRESFDVAINGGPYIAIDVSSSGFSSYTSQASGINAFQTGPFYLSTYTYGSGTSTPAGSLPSLDFTLATASTLTFGIPDNLFGDNKGGVSLAITAAVPETETYALMLGGLGILGFVARRRRSV